MRKLIGYLSEGSINFGLAIIRLGIMSMLHRAGYGFKGFSQAAEAAIHFFEYCLPDLRSTVVIIRFPSRVNLY